MKTSLKTTVITISIIVVILIALIITLYYVGRKQGRKAAATELYNLAKAYEKVTYETIYRKCYYSSRQSCWKYIGKAHDYSY